ncbi:MAG: hypothetical protein OXH09_05315 [Gammaproteobacteria bacterium]|nr:hypothetical protein [Gammaproteobacteria bacterium]
MRIVRLTGIKFPVPFKVVFRHASASRDRAENLIVAAHSEDGHVGYGEGCPRDYVTGETTGTCVDFVRRHGDSLIAEVRDLASLRAWIADHANDIDRNPAAFCAVETALLDLLGRLSGKCIEELLDMPRPGTAFKYSAVLGNAPHLAYLCQLRRYRRRGFDDFKIKLSGDARSDGRKLRALAGTAERVRVDANNLWTSADGCIRYLAGLPGKLFAIEEPLEAGDLAGFRAVGEATGARIVLDESLARIEQLDTLTDPDRWIVNIRVSKMGGILRSMAVARRASRLGVGIIVGCQVGETSLLTRAAMPVMQAAREDLLAAEGAFGTYLLRQDLTTPCLMFGHAGRLSPDQVPDGPGFGLTVSDDLLELLDEP